MDDTRRGRTSHTSGISWEIGAAVQRERPDTRRLATAG